MAQPLETPWIRRTKWLTQALIISGTLNIGLLATFVYFVMEERQESFAIESLVVRETPSVITNGQLLSAYSLLPYQELILRLENNELIEEGLTRRDLALACLVAYHYFNLERSLGGFVPQKRQIALPAKEGQAPRELTVFPGLTDPQYQAMLHYARTEKWPQTAQGLFQELKSQRDPTLIEALTLTTEYQMLHALFAKTGMPPNVDSLVDLLCQIEWQPLAALTDHLRQSLNFTPEARRSFLLEALEGHSTQAAQLLLRYDLDYTLKRLNDAQVLTLLDCLHEQTPELQTLALELLASPRTDPVWHKAAAHLYAAVGEAPPMPYDHSAVLKRFLPQSLSAELLTQSKQAIKSAVPKKLHTIEPGDSLWKISRKYQVSIEEIMRVNNLETERLRSGRKLEIPTCENK